jgi:hypothetical protein
MVHITVWTTKVTYIKAMREQAITSTTVPVKHALATGLAEFAPPVSETRIHG